MNPYYEAMMGLVIERDRFYLYVFLTVATGVLLYRLAGRRYFKWFLIAGVVLVIGAIVYGLALRSTGQV